MIEVITMVIEKGTGISIQRHELVGAVTTVARLRNLAIGRSAWQPVRVELTGLGDHIDMTPILRTSPKMVQYGQILHRVVLPMWLIACIRYQP